MGDAETGGAGSGGPGAEDAGPPARAAAAMRAAPRAAFLPRETRGLASWDEALPIGRGSTCSQPTTVRRMLELLDVRPGQRVLDVGSGSGWTTACLAWLASPGGSVVGVELDESLVERSRRALAELWPEDALGDEAGPQRESTERPRSSWRIEVARPGVLGWPEDAPYDRILVSADASGRVPGELIDQLGDPAVLVIPVAGTMMRVRVREGAREVTTHGRYVFVPLRE